jgi:uncharacterized protein YbaA (DUF1428 family)
MSNPNLIEKINENKGGFVGLYIYRSPKKNHDALMQINNQVTNTFKRCGMHSFEVFQLGNTEDMMEFVNISKTISADKEDEVWLEIQSYRDRKHVDEVMAKMENNEDMKVLYQQFLDVITPGSRCIFGGFNRLEGIGFI